MKKIFTLSAGLCFAITAFAQKDLEIKLLSPKSGDKIYVMESIPLTYSIKNVGSETITPQDSVFVNMKMDGDYVLGAFYQKYIPHGQLTVGDSVFTTISFVFTQEEPVPFDFCFEMVTRNNQVPFDTQPNNDESCEMITVSTRTTTGVTDLVSEGVKLYPNPTTNTITVEASLLNVSKAVITDILGTVKSETIVATANQQLNIEGLCSGIYFCKLTDSSNNVIGTVKFTVTK